LSFLEGFEDELLKAAAMEEDFPSVLGMNEPESSVANDFSNDSLHRDTSTHEK
jgi:hypothetical protein